MNNTNMVNVYYDFISNDGSKTYESICVGVFEKLKDALTDINTACTQTLTSYVATDIAGITGILRWAGEACFDTNIFNMAFPVSEVIDKARVIFMQFSDRLFSRGIISLNSDRELAFKAFFGYATLENGQNLFIDMHYDIIPAELKKVKSPLYKPTVVYSNDTLYSVNRLLGRVSLNSFSELDDELMCYVIRKIKASKDDVKKLRGYTTMRFDNDSFMKALDIIHGFFNGAGERKLKDVKKDIGKMIYKEHRDNIPIFAYAFDSFLLSFANE